MCAVCRLERAATCFVKSSPCCTTCRRLRKAVKTERAQFLMQNLLQNVDEVRKYMREEEEKRFWQTRIQQLKQAHAQNNALHVQIPHDAAAGATMMHDGNASDEQDSAKSAERAQTAALVGGHNGAHTATLDCVAGDVAQGTMVQAQQVAANPSVGNISVPSAQSGMSFFEYSNGNVRFHIPADSVSVKFLTDVLKSDS